MNVARNPYVKFLGLQHWYRSQSSKQIITSVILLACCLAAGSIWLAIIAIDSLYYDYYDTVSWVAGMGPGAAIGCQQLGTPASLEVPATAADFPGAEQYASGKSMGLPVQRAVLVLTSWASMRSGDTWSWSGPLVDANKAAWAAQCGYTFKSVPPPTDYDRKPAWWKVYLMAKELKSMQWTWVLWLDADAVLMQPGVCMDTLFAQAEASGHDIVGTDDGGGLNTGAWAARGNGGLQHSKSATAPWAAGFLQMVYAQEDLITPPPEAGLLYEQYAVQTCLDRWPAGRAHLRVVPPCAINSQPRKSLFDPALYYPGLPVYHTAGFHGQTKATLLCRALAASGVQPTWPAHSWAAVPEEIQAHCTAPV